MFFSNSRAHFFPAAYLYERCVKTEIFDYNPVVDSKYVKKTDFVQALSSLSSPPPTRKQARTLCNTVKYYENLNNINIFLLNYNL